jgi:hypothetical protein
MRIQGREPQSTYSDTEIYGSKDSKENIELKFQYLTLAEANYQLLIGCSK